MERPGTRDASRTAPSAAAPGWLRVGMKGEASSTSTGSRSARATLASPCTDVEMIQSRRSRRTPLASITLRSGRWTPSARARSASPASSPTSTRTPRGRQHPISSRTSRSRACAFLCRTITADPRGRAAALSAQSASTPSSVIRISPPTGQDGAPALSLRAIRASLPLSRS